MLIPTSDFEEEWKSESDEDDALEQIVQIYLNIEGSGPQVFDLHVTKHGVRKLLPNNQCFNLHLAKLTKTVVPILVGNSSQTGLAERKADWEPENVNSLASVTSDLATSPASSLTSPVIPWDEHQDVGTSLKQKRSLSPVCFEVSQKTTAALKRQNTFVESCSQTNDDSEAEVGARKLKRNNSVTQTEEVLIKCVIKAVPKETQTEDKLIGVIETQTEVKEIKNEIKSCTMLGTQTIPIAVSQASMQTDPLPIKEEYITHEIPFLARTPCNELTFNYTQTSPTSLAHMNSQTSPPGSSRTRENSPSSLRQSSRTSQKNKQPKLSMLTQPGSDEMVCRVLLEHAGCNNGSAESDRSSVCPKSHASDVTGNDSDRCPSFLSMESGRATSYDIAQPRSYLDGQNIDLARSVNYLDLSKLGNEGETPNSDEIWVTVEDDNKFLTSDTETYSVATDKVSTMATFKGHVVGSGVDNNALLNSASEAELAELGNESLASDLDGQDFSTQHFGTLLHSEIEPIRSCLDSTGRTVTGIADTLYHIQDGINNLCCNVTQMKSKVLSSFESDQTMFSNATKSDEKLELVKDGVPVGEPEHLVERMVNKLDSALRRRDENLQKAMLSLEEDNLHLRREVEMYRQRESGVSQRNSELEGKIQEVLDNMENLRRKTPPHMTPRQPATPRSDTTNEKELPPIDCKAVPKFKRRSKSRAKSKSRETSSSDSKCKESIKLKPKRQNAYQNDSTTSSDSEQNHKQGKVKGAIQVDMLQTMVQTAQHDNTALRQDLIIQKEREAQLVKRNIELEAKLIRALTPRQEKSPQPSPTGEVISSPLIPPIPKKVEQGTKDVQTSANIMKKVNCDSKSVNTDDTLLPPPLTVESPSSSSPSKSESPVKDQEALKVKPQNRKSRPREKVKKAGTMDEVTEIIEVYGRGNGVEGGTPSPSPSRETERKPKDIPDTPTENKEKSPTDKDQINNNKKAVEPKKIYGEKEKASEKKSVGKTSPKSDTSSSNNKNGKISNEKNTKKVTIDDSKKTRDKSKGEGKQSKQEASAKMSGNQLTVNLSDTSKSKVIEGDDFRVTITSNQELVSCELSDREDDPGSPRKKIVVTPKTPDKKKEKEKKQEAVVTKKGGKIPIRQTYIKQKAELPAPQQYPAARPPKDQLPHPVPRNYPVSCGNSPSSFNSPMPMAMSMNYPMTVNYVGYNHNIPPTPTNDYGSMCSPSDRSLASTNIPISGRNTGMSYDGGDVFTMMIKQDSRDSNVYDAPSYIPDITDMRESPDGAYSYVIDGPAMSSMSNISDLKPDFEEESSDGFERDIIMEFVMMEEKGDMFTDRKLGPSPFKGYAERVKQKVIHEFVKANTSRGNKVKSVDPESSGRGKPNVNHSEERNRPPTRVLPVRKRGRKLFKSRAQSLSMDKLNEMNSPQKPPSRLSKSRNTFYSSERLPTLTASEEERIHRLKKYEDETEKINEKRETQMRAKERHKLKKQHSFQNGHVTIYETDRPRTVPEEFKLQAGSDMNPQDFADNYNANYIEQNSEPAFQQIPEQPQDLCNEQNSQTDNNREDDGGISQKRRKLKKFRGLSPMSRANGKVSGLSQLPLSVECFIVSRGWQIDQAQLNKAISKLDGINFVRIQMANTINRVIENIRPHNDVVLIHIGTTELSEACHSISSPESVPG